ncbi:MAG: hypothetical protein QXJ93_02145 [Candidatus Rehaiarchaeum fermentans]|nr:hypothetical protein [Candidatus Rehaiarchaeum fermentans]MCW1311630.1 hypothetical protein [Candidatus Rehaiarchaeum fermentans]
MRSTSIIDEIIFVIILVLFSFIILSFFLHSYFSTLGVRQLPSINESRPLACNISIISKIGSSSNCVVSVRAEGGTSGLIYTLYNSKSKLCSYVAGYSYCDYKVNVTNNDTLICNTTGKSPYNESYLPGGGYSLYISC